MPVRGTLAPGKTFVWFTAVNSVSDPLILAEFLSLLSAEEQRQHQAFHFDTDRHLYLVAHALLRTSLSQYSEVQPASWTFSCGKFGRPEIDVSVPVNELIRFNLSHTSGLAACAIARDVDIGIDVECLDRRTSCESIASRFFSPTEFEQLTKLPEAERQRRFLEYWTLKEAYIKACGMGLSMPLDSFCFYRDASGEWRIRFTDGNDNPKEWQFICLQPTTSHVMSIAIRLAQDPVHDVHVIEFVPSNQEV